MPSVSEPPIPTLLKLAKAAELLGSTYMTVRRLALKGEIPYVMIGHQRRIRYDDLLAYIDRGAKHAGE
jgi:excisionase family DNA binding protein